MFHHFFHRRITWCYIFRRQTWTVRRQLFNTLLYTSALFVIVYSCLGLYNSRHPSTELLKRSQEQQSSSNQGDAVTKLLFLSYCRAGSSISSEIYDVDERAILWYEPLDAFYFAKTGYYGRKDQKALMLHNETDFRPIESWEYTDIADFFSRLYTCQLKGLPAEFLAHRFIKHSSSLQSYYQCYQHDSPESITQDLDACRDRLEHVCGKSVHKSIQNKCLAIMAALHEAKPLSSSQRVVHIQQHLIGYGLDRTDVGLIMRSLLSYRNCLDKLEPIIDKCLSRAEQACLSKRLRAIKAVRTSMKVVRSVMNTITDLLIVIFVRDPRAMAYSRAGKHKEDYHILNNLRLICKKLKLDFTMAQDINTLYPGSVLIVKYENFVQAPFYWTTRMYGHIGYSTPTKLDYFIRVHMFSGEDDGKKWGNIRPNATELAYRWRQLVSPALMTSMQDQCGDVIAMLDYPMY